MTRLIGLPLGLLLGPLLCLVLAACAGAAPTPSGVPSVPEATWPLVELLPPGPQVVLVAKPDVLAQSDAVRRLWRTLVTEQREAAFQVRTGVDPRAVSDLVVFEVARGGYVLLARGRFDAASVVRRAADRLAVIEVSQDAPVLRREGLAGQGRYSFAVLDPQALLVAKDADPALVASILARVEEPNAPRLLDSAEGAGLYAEHATSPFLLLAPRPLSLPPATPVALLLAQEKALCAAITPSGSRLGVTIAMRGTFPKGVETNFRTLAASIGKSPLGAALGFSSVAEHMRIQVDEQGAITRFEIESSEVASGLRLLFFDEMRQLFP